MPEQQVKTGGLTEEKSQLALEMRRQGKSYEDINLALGIHNNVALRNLFHANGLTKSTHEQSREIDRKIQAMRAEGKTDKEIAEALGYTIGSIQTRFRNLRRLEMQRMIREPK